MALKTQPHARDLNYQANQDCVLQYICNLMIKIYQWQSKHLKKRRETVTMYSGVM